MAVGDDLDTLWEAHQRSHFSGRAALEEPVEGEAPRTRDVTLPRIARCTRLSFELLCGSHVQDEQPFFAEPTPELVERYVFHCSRNSRSTALNRSGCSIVRR
jgi:hypothetical protein